MTPILLYSLKSWYSDILRIWNRRLFRVERPTCQRYIDLDGKFQNFNCAWNENQFHNYYTMFPRYCRLPTFDPGQQKLSLDHVPVLSR
jgi:hypothetical protein